MENLDDKPRDPPKEKARKLGWLGEKTEPRRGFEGLPNILITAIISLLMAFLMVFLVAPSKGDLQEFEAGASDSITAQSSRVEGLINNAEVRSNNKTEAVQSELNTYKGEVSNSLSRIESKVDSLGSQVSALAGLEGKIDAGVSKIGSEISSKVDAKLAEVDAKLAALDEKVEEKKVESETRWRFRDPEFLDISNPDIWVEVTDCDRIEEEGLYEVELTIGYSMSLGAPHSNADIKSGILLRLVPDDPETLPDRDTYLEVDHGFPGLDWETYVETRDRKGEEICRWIEFESDNYHFTKSGNLEDGETIILDLVLDLIYES